MGIGSYCSHAPRPTVVDVVFVIVCRNSSSLLHIIIKASVSPVGRIPRKSWLKFEDNYRFPNVAFGMARRR